MPPTRRLALPACPNPPPDARPLTPTYAVSAISGESSRRSCCSRGRRCRPCCRGFCWMRPCPTPLPKRPMEEVQRRHWRWGGQTWMSCAGRRRREVGTQQHASLKAPSLALLSIVGNREGPLPGRWACNRDRSQPCCRALWAHSVRWQPLLTLCCGLPHLTSPPAYCRTLPPAAACRRVRQPQLCRPAGILARAHAVPLRHVRGVLHESALAGGACAGAQAPAPRGGAGLASWPPLLAQVSAAPARSPAAALPMHAAGKHCRPCASHDLAEQGQGRSGSLAVELQEVGPTGPLCAAVLPAGPSPSSPPTTVPCAGCMPPARSSCACTCWASGTPA